MEDLHEQIESFQRCIDERDAALAETVLHPDFELVLVQPTPAVMPRARWLEVLGDYVVHACEVHERVVDVDGDLAAVLHRATQQATVLGQDRGGELVITDVWRRTDAGWRVWRRHSTPLGAGPMPGA